MTAFMASLLFVTLAEMGDKTQLLAVAFATRFPAPTVLAAVFVATLLNHALAVAAGRLLTTVIPLEVISLVTALSFLLFGLWTIRGDTLEGEHERQSAFGPFLTVVIAFFIAELGDKTQLATISLAVKYENPLSVLLGTTAGMVAADGLGIVLGVVLGGRLPDTLIRLVSAGIFVGFGLFGAGTLLPTWLSRTGTVLTLFGVTVATLGAAHALLLQQRHGQGVAARPAPLPRRGAQALFATLLLVGWFASLGVVTPVAAIDHWVAFALLAGLGWKLIHEAVRPRITPPHLPAGTAGLILFLAMLTAVHVAFARIPWALLLIPASILVAAIVVIVAGPAAARRRQSDRLRQMSRHRLAIASGLLLVGMAVQILIEHLV